MGPRFRHSAVAPLHEHRLCARCPSSLQRTWLLGARFYLRSCCAAWCLGCGAWHLLAGPQKHWRPDADADHRGAELAHRLVLLHLRRPRWHRQDAHRALNMSARLHVCVHACMRARACLCALKRHAFMKHACVQSAGGCVLHIWHAGVSMWHARGHAHGNCAQWPRIDVLELRARPAHSAARGRSVRQQR